jgi:hypothetical protein
MRISSILVLGAVAGLGAVLLMRLTATERPRLQTEMITVDHITVPEAIERARPYLSRDGQIFSPGGAPNSVSIIDDREHVALVEEALSRADVPSEEVTLHFQVIRLTENGPKDPAVQNVSNALRGLLRLDGYELMGQTVMSLAENRSGEQRVPVGRDSPLRLTVRVLDVRRRNEEASVEMSIALRGGTTRLSTNIVIPNGQTVVLGGADLGGRADQGLLLTVRPVMGSHGVRTTSRATVSHVWKAEMATHADSMSLVADSSVARWGEDVIVDPFHGRVETSVVVPTPKKSTKRISPVSVPPVPPRPPEAR